jgi:hypothetical protein
MFFACCWCLLLSSQALALTKVTATIDKNPAMQNESIVLTVIADDDVNSNALDTSPLLSDFIVGRTSVSSQTNMVNFKTSRTTQWQVVLIARRSGEFTIPPLTIENQATMPISLTVVEQNESIEANQQDIFITSELSSTEVYVQQLITLTLKLHFSVELKSGNITEPNLLNSNIEKIGQDKQSDEIINGKRYRVIEQVYAITPQQSGDLTLAAPVFSGDIMTASKRRSSFLSFAQTKPVSVRGEETLIKVKASPNNYPNNDVWLPSELLTLHQEWQNKGKVFKVGEPITRTITLTAAGLAKTQLPEIIMPSTSGLKIYPDQAQLHSNLTKERLVSQKVQNFALVPSKAGQFTLPEISITWFNTVTNKTQYATLPQETIMVEAGEGVLPVDLKQATVTDNVEATPLALGPQSTKKNSATEKSKLTWVFLALWLLTLLFWFLHVIYLKRHKDQKKEPKKYISTNSNSHIALLAACKKNNASQALGLILPWLNQLLNTKEGELSTIAQAEKHVDEQHFSTALNDLQAHLYGKSAVSGAPSWQGEALLAAIEVIIKKHHNHESKKGSFTLNP